MPSDIDGNVLPLQTPLAGVQQQAAELSRRATATATSSKGGGNESKRVTLGEQRRRHTDGLAAAEFAIEQEEDGGGGEGEDLGLLFTPEMWSTEDVVLWLGWTGKLTHPYQSHVCPVLLRQCQSKIRKDVFFSRFLFVVDYLSSNKRAMSTIGMRTI